jgi:UDP-GlcNAc:undecaprenyl-phosphate/decaprenyl-phosphate GlcNAc-1-phosphate transferase
MIEKIILSFITSFGITYFAIPSLISVARIKNLYDEPGARKSHSTNIPTLGGLAIFAGIIFSISFWTDFSELLKLQYIIASIVVLFFIGIKDDIVTLSPFKKAVGQLIAVLILTIWGDVRVQNFFGIFGINEVPYVVSVIFSAFVMLVIVNAYNLIDGINGLASGLGIIASFTFGVWFLMTGVHLQQAIVAFSLCGALLAFLRYNVSPARIFMGDTGSMLLGLLIAVFTIEFISINEQYQSSLPLKSAPVVAIGVIIVPLFDLLRVFILRVSRGRSPFHPDKSHIHHILLKLELSHGQSTIILVITSIFFIVFSLIFDFLGNYYLLAFLILLATLLTYISRYLVLKHKSSVSKNQ